MYRTKSVSIISYLCLIAWVSKIIYITHTVWPLNMQTLNLHILYDSPNVVQRFIQRLHLMHLALAHKVCSWWYSASLLNSGLEIAFVWIIRGHNLKYRKFEFSFTLVIPRCSVWARDDEDCHVKQDILATVLSNHDVNQYFEWRCTCAVQ